MHRRGSSLPDHPLPILQPARQQRNKDWATGGQTERALLPTGRNSAGKLRSVQRPRPASGGSLSRDRCGPDQNTTSPANRRNRSLTHAPPCSGTPPIDPIAACAWIAGSSSADGCRPENGPCSEFRNRPRHGAILAGSQDPLRGMPSAIEYLPQFSQGVPGYRTGTESWEDSD